MSQKDSSKSFPYFCPFWRLRWVPETIKFYLKVAMLQVFALKSRTLRFPCCAKSRSATTSPTRAEARKPSFSSKTRPAAIRQMSLTPTCWRENSKSTSRSRKSWTLKRLLTSRWSRGASVAERELWKTIKYIPFFTQVAASQLVSSLNNRCFAVI